ncbi:hypothetical protein BV898_00739 [Hypsibius exemplaris]|uniref:DOMON domain-containing protein n=1 Tax=Hypsibius exemplaris TaxID=2072580 RepID=A0A1W0XEC0_HYPEX|nr:hypothetical protein BV898_00739 [Hypsibius exemplaris]
MCFGAGRVSGQNVADGFPTQDCGTTHGCIGFPEDSCLANGRCIILLKFAFDPAFKDRVPVEIYGTPPSFRPQNFWIAVGFNTEPQKMGGALVTECVYNNGAAGVFSSRNVPNAYANQRILLTGVIPGNGSLHNGILGCSFVLHRERKVNEMTYDLAQPFYIIAGSGPAMGSMVRQHFQRPSMSNDAIVIAPLDNSAIPPPPPQQQQPSPVERTTPSSSNGGLTTLRSVLFDKFIQGPFPPTTSTPMLRTTVGQLRPDQLLPDRVPALNNVQQQFGALPQVPMNAPASFGQQQQQVPINGGPAFGMPNAPPVSFGVQNLASALGQMEDSPKLINEETVVNMVMRFIEPPLKMIVDILNRGNLLRYGYRSADLNAPLFKPTA